MTRNESTLDRTVRLVLGAAAIVWAGMLGWSTAGGIVLVVLGAVLLVTAAIGFCPLYRLLGLSTARRERVTHTARH